MPQSLSKILVHIVFSTKHRKPFLEDPVLREQIYAYIASILNDKLDSPAIKINGMPDHIHILCSLSRKFAAMNVIKEIKTASTKWLKKQSTQLASFAWQSGYGIFSVSESNSSNVKRYIEQQERHHQSLSFQDEFRELCRRHSVELDERYAWD